VNEDLRRKESEEEGEGKEDENRMTHVVFMPKAHMV
jgi:hypothetical protein